MPLIRDYVAEHERSTDLGGMAVRAMDRGDLDQARVHLAAMAAELAAHWKGEENGIFRVMQRRDADYADYIEPLVREHRELADLLDRADLTDPADQERVRVAVFELGEHISKEEDGLFPASLIALNGEDWDDSMAAWAEAHPGRTLLAD